MYRLDRFFESTIPRLGGFQYKKSLSCLDYFTLPPINRLNPRDDICTGSQPCIHHCFTNPYRFSLIYCRNQDNKNLLPWFLHNRVPSLQSDGLSALLMIPAHFLLPSYGTKQFLGLLRIEQHDYDKLSISYHFTSYNLTLPSLFSI